MMQYICSKAVTLVLLLSLHVHTHSDASSSNVAVNSTSAGDGSSLAQTLVLPPATKWTQCFSNGRLNTIFSVNSDAAGKVHAGLALPAQAAVSSQQACSHGQPLQLDFISLNDSSVCFRLRHVLVLTRCP
jgi:hypothetical protein